MNSRHLIRRILFAVAFSFAAQAFASSKTLRVGIEIQYPPFEYYDADNKPAGFDIELLQALSRQLGATAKLIDTKFANLMMGLKANRYDMVISGLYINPDRARQSQTIAYAMAGASIVVPKNSTLKANAPEDLCGRKIGLIGGSTWVAQLRKVSEDHCVPQGKGAIAVQEYPSAPEVTQAVISRNVDAQMEIAVACELIVKSTGDRLKITSSQTIFPQTLGIFVRQGDDATYQAILKAFDGIKANGEYEALLKRYKLDPVPSP